MTETTTGNNQRSHVASGHVPFVPSAVGSESTTTSLVPGAQQPNLNGSSLITASYNGANGQQITDPKPWKVSDEYIKLGGLEDDQKMSVLLA